MSGFGGLKRLEGAWGTWVGLEDLRGLRSLRGHEGLGLHLVEMLMFGWDFKVNAYLNTIEHCWKLLNAIEHYRALLNTIEHCLTLLNAIEHYRTLLTLLNTIEHYWVLVNTIEHHGNRLYGFMRLGSKMWDWMDGWSGVEWVIPLRLLWLLEHLRC